MEILNFEEILQKKMHGCSNKSRFRFMRFFFAEISIPQKSHPWKFLDFVHVWCRKGHIWKLGQDITITFSLSSPDTKYADDSNILYIMCHGRDVLKNLKAFPVTAA